MGNRCDKIIILLKAKRLYNISTYLLDRILVGMQFKPNIEK